MFFFEFNVSYKEWFMETLISSYNYLHFCSLFMIAYSFFEQQFSRYFYEKATCYIGVTLIFYNRKK